MSFLSSLVLVEQAWTYSAYKKGLCFTCHTVQINLFRHKSITVKSQTDVHVLSYVVWIGTLHHHTPICCHCTWTSPPWVLAFLSCTFMLSVAQFLQHPSFLTSTFPRLPFCRGGQWGALHLAPQALLQAHPTAPPPLSLSWRWIGSALSVEQREIFHVFILINPLFPYTLPLVLHGS